MIIGVKINTISLKEIISSAHFGQWRNGKTTINTKQNQFEMHVAEYRWCKRYSTSNVCRFFQQKLEKKLNHSN